jgi:flagellar assembly protein FliH
MRASPAKYMFENDFASGAAGKPSIPLDEHTAKLKETEAAAYARGVEQAMAAAANEGAQRSAAALESIAEALRELDNSLGAVEARLESEAVEVAVAVARKLAPELVAREPLTEMTALAAGCFRNLVKTPHVAVRVNDALHATARQQLEEVFHRCGFDSRLVVLAEPDIAPGDCLIEWADGGIRRDSAAIAAAIDEAVKRYLAARLASAENSGAASPSIQRRDQQ